VASAITATASWHETPLVRVTGAETTALKKSLREALLAAI
jgi:hypothetical protein